jgi:outer membrane protein OmpA-like peptidoglycan-associated protein
MKKVLLALLGLILLAILSFFCFQNKADAIREDLVATTNSALLNAELDGVKANLKGSGLEVTDIMQLTGVVPSLDQKAKAETVALAVEGVGGVENMIQVTQRQEVAAAPKAEPTPVVEVKKEKVATIDPYTLTITKDENNQLLLEGYVDSKEREQALVEKANKLFGAENVTNHLKIAAGAPQDWEHISAFALDRLKDVDYGDMKLLNQSYEFTGHLPSPSSKSAFLDGIRKVMSDPDNKYGRYRGDYIITAPIQEITTSAPTQTATTPEVEEKKQSATNSIQSCQAELDAILDNKKVLFDYNMASIKYSSYPLLNQVINTLKACHITKLEIAGHTDNLGNESYNLQLSKRRAEAVKRYFVKKGIDRNLLEAQGYGEINPVASNATSEGRAENRRIEFIVKGVEK